MYTICVWPDGTWCHHDEVHEMTHMSDDYALVPIGDEGDPDDIAHASNQ